MKPNVILLAGLLAAAVLPGMALAQPFPGAEAAAERGDPRAAFALALMYDTGDGVPRDYDRALFWFRKAAEGGYAVAQAKLGVMYLFGWALPPDPAEAASWYRKAAVQGYVVAEARLARLYALGIGVRKNTVEAYVWADRAARQADAQSAWFRDRLAEGMTSDELTKAQTLAKRPRPRR